jgi:ABC-type Co2+ transport system permease subunit
MTTKLLANGLFPGRLWIYRRLKIYVWAALGTVSAFLFVAGWIARAASEGASFKIFLATFGSLVLGFWAFRLLAAEAFPDMTHHRRRRTP